MRIEDVTKKMDSDDDIAKKLASRPITPKPSRKKATSKKSAPVPKSTPLAEVIENGKKTDSAEAFSPTEEPIVWLKTIRLSFHVIDSVDDLVKRVKREHGIKGASRYLILGILFRHQYSQLSNNEVYALLQSRAEEKISTEPQKIALRGSEYKWISGVVYDMRTIYGVLNLDESKIFDSVITSALEKVPFDTIITDLTPIAAS